MALNKCHVLVPVNKIISINFNKNEILKEVKVVVASRLGIEATNWFSLEYTWHGYVLWVDEQETINDFLREKGALSFKFSPKFYSSFLIEIFEESQRTLDFLWLFFFSEIFVDKKFHCSTWLLAKLSAFMIFVEFSEVNDECGTSSFKGLTEYALKNRIFEDKSFHRLVLREIKDIVDPQKQKLDLLMWIATFPCFGVEFYDAVVNL